MAKAKSGFNRPMMGDNIMPASFFGKIELLRKLKNAGVSVETVAGVCGVEIGTAQNWLRGGNGKAPNDENYQKLKAWADANFRD